MKQLAIGIALAVIVVVASPLSTPRYMATVVLQAVLVVAVPESA